MAMSQVVATNVAFLSMTCQFSAIISSECPGAQVLNIQHYTTSIYYFVHVHMRDFCTVSLYATGLSPDLQSMEQIRRIMRPTDVPDQGTTCLEWRMEIEEWKIKQVY